MRLGRLFLLVALWCAAARADRQGDEAKRLNERASGAYALGHYAEAAVLFEQAFDAKPIPELLFNAAQAHRFAGNKARALQLYENCLRVYGDRLNPHHDEIELHITELRFALAQERDRAAAPAPAPAVPVAPAPVEHVAPAPVEQAAPALTTSVPPPAPKKSRAWVWGVVVGAVAVVGVAVGLGVGLGSSTRDPSPSLGTLGAQ